MTANRFATRLNSFASRPQAEWPDLTGKPSPMQMAARAAKVEGLTDLDLNFPDHVSEKPAEIARKLGDLGHGAPRTRRLRRPLPQSGGVTAILPRC